MARNHVRTTVANDYTEVESKIQLLLQTWEISSDELVDLEITHFGDQKFLIVIVYTGTYIVFSKIGLVSYIIQAIAKAPKKALLGLSSSIKFGMTRIIKAGLGMISAIDKGSYTVHRIKIQLLGINSSIYRTLEYANRDLSPTAGLTCSVGFVHTG